MSRRRSAGPVKLARQARAYDTYAAAARARGDHAAAEECEQRASSIRRSLQAQGRCSMCGRDLTDPTSVRLGIGPDCRSKAEVRA